MLVIVMQEFYSLILLKLMIKHLASIPAKWKIIIYQIRKLILQEAMVKRKDVYPIDFLAVQLQWDRRYDAAMYYNAKVTMLHFVMLPKLVSGGPSWL